MDVKGLAAEVLCAGLALGTLSVLSIGAAKGVRSFRFALGVLALSILPFAKALQECRSVSARIREPLIECLDISPIYPILGIGFGMMTIVLKLARDGAKETEERFGAAWRTAAAVLEEGWEQQGKALRGTYRAHRIAAAAENSPPVTQYDPGIHTYRVEVFTEPGGPPWSLRRYRAFMHWLTPEWRARSHHRGVARRLEGAGALDLVRAAERYMDLSRGPHIIYRPKSGALTFQDNSGSVPGPDIFRKHLDLLVELRAVNYQVAKGHWSSSPSSTGA